MNADAIDIRQWEVSCGHEIYWACGQLLGHNHLTLGWLSEEKEWVDSYFLCTKKWESKF